MSGMREMTGVTLQPLNGGDFSGIKKQKKPQKE